MKGYIQVSIEYDSIKIDGDCNPQILIQGVPMA
jgi:hypothetical protein